MNSSFPNQDYSRSKSRGNASFTCNRNKRGGRYRGKLKDKSKLTELNNKIREIYNPSQRRSVAGSVNDNKDNIKNNLPDDASVITGTDTYDSGN